MVHQLDFKKLMSNKIKIIAEAGCNHNGSITNAKKLIDIAKTANADYVKFQFYNADSLLLVGTSIELAVADHIDHFQLPGSPLVPSLFNKFFETVKIHS